jgi:hypothetical protein
VYMGGVVQGICTCEALQGQRVARHMQLKMRVEDRRGERGGRERGRRGGGGEQGGRGCCKMGS